MHEEQGAYHHLEVEATSRQRQEDSSRDASSSRGTNLTPTNGTKTGTSVSVADLMCRCGTIAKRAHMSAAGILIKKPTTVAITNNILQQDINLAQRRSTRRCYHSQDMSGVND